MNPSTPKIRKPYVPEKPSVVRAIAKWGFVIAGIAGIVWMIASIPREKQMTCSGSPFSITYFGTCTQEE